MTGSYCLLCPKNSHVSHPIILITVCAQNVRLQHERKCIDLDAKRQVANSTFNNRLTQSGSLAVNASFQFVDLRDLDMIYLLLINFNK